MSWRPSKSFMASTPRHPWSPEASRRGLNTLRHYSCRSLGPRGPAFHKTLLWPVPLLPILEFGVSAAPGAEPLYLAAHLERQTVQWRKVPAIIVTVPDSRVLCPGRPAQRPEGDSELSPGCADGAQAIVVEACAH
jgi:hypothetical protein